MLSYQEQVPLRQHTTLKTGGFAKLFVEVTSESELQVAYQFACEQSLPVLVLGGGSNMLVADEGFPGLVIKINLRGSRYVPLAGQPDEVLMEVQAGELLDAVVAQSIADGWYGLENLSAIPGTVGATPVQNVGAYGVEVADVIQSVKVYDQETDSIKIFTNETCAFSYRHSLFKTSEGERYVVVAVTFLLTRNFVPKISYTDLKNYFGELIPTALEVRAAVQMIRSKKFPDWTRVGTAGSFFKNPIIPKSEAIALLSAYPLLPVYEVDENNVKIPLGFVLDKICGLKGFTDGGVGLFAAQALVLVHDGTVTTHEILNFVSLIQKKVFEKTKIKIEPEVRFINIKNIL